MTTDTTHPPAAADQDQAPPDIATMRMAVDRLLDPDAVPEALPPAADEVDTLTLQLREHIQLLAPEVEQAARKKLKPGSTPHYRVLGCVWEARSRLEAQPSPRYGGALGYARRLARALNALCDHYETLHGDDETPERAAYRRVLEHGAGCEDGCRAMDDEGVNS